MNAAVEQLENEIGWNAKDAALINSEQVTALWKKAFNGHPIVLDSTATLSEIIPVKSRPLWDMVDIVIPVPADQDVIEKFF